MTTIFTVGHSRHTAEHFTSLLRAHEIERLVDVRSHPASKWAPHFAKTALAQTLATHAIEYVFLARELGGRPGGAECYREDGSIESLATCLYRLWCCGQLAGLAKNEIVPLRPIIAALGVGFLFNAVIVWRYFFAIP